MKSETTLSGYKGGPPDVCTTIPPFCVEVSIVMPCLNEADTLALCIEKAHRSLREAAITGEVIVADPGCHHN